jgi:hypothetical protein
MRPIISRRYAEVPPQLRKIPGWVLFKLGPEKANGKRDKLPYYADGTPRRGTQGSDQDRAKLGTFDQVRKRFERGGLDGIGLATLPDFGIVGIDIDHCIDDGKPSSLAEEIIEASDGTYCEVSPSGKGLRLFSLGKFADKKAHNTGLETFHAKSFLTVTGQRINGAEVRKLTPELESLLREKLEPQRGTHKGAVAAPRFDPTNERDVAELESALVYLVEHGKADDYKYWRDVGPALGRAFRGDERGFEIYEKFASHSDKRDRPGTTKQMHNLYDLWKTEHPNPITVASIFFEARELGWRPPKPTKRNKRPTINDGPMDILSDVVAPPLRPEDFPEVIANYADLFTRTSGFDFTGMAMAMVLAACTVIDDSIKIQLSKKTQWFEPARLWMFLLGLSGAAKTPLLKAAMEPVMSIHAGLIRDWEVECSKIKKKEEWPSRPALITNDTTLAALQETLLDNPQGVTHYTNELGAWLGQHDLFNNGQGSHDRNAWMQLYDGDANQVDRIRRGKALIENWGCSIVSATTYAMLQGEKNKLPPDGLIQRFMSVCVPSDHEPDDSIPDAEIEAARHAYSKMIGELEKLTDRGKVRLSPEANYVFAQRRDELNAETRMLATTNAPLAAHVAKHLGMLGRLMLIFHAIKQVTIGNDPTEDEVSEETARQAIRVLRILTAHASVVYDELAGASSSGAFIAKHMARSLLADKKGEVTRSYFMKHCDAFKNAPGWIKPHALNRLVDTGWIVPDEESRGFRGEPSRYTVHPRVQEKFGEHGVMHRERRAAVKRIIEAGR